MLDGRTHRFLKEIPLGRVEAEGNFLTVNTRRNKVYCTTAEEEGRIIVIDSDRDSIVKVINPPSLAGRLDYNPINDKVYCANWANGLTIIDGEDDTIITHLSLPFYPYYGLIWYPGLNKVYCGEGGMVGVIDGATNQLLKIVPGPEYSQLKYAYNLKSNKLYITYYDIFHGGGLGIFDCLRDTFVTFLPRGKSIGVDWDEKDNKVYFSYTGRVDWQNRIGVVDGETDSLIHIFSIPVCLYHLLWNPNNNKIYVACDVGGCLVIDCETDSILEIPVLRDYNEGFAQPLVLNLENGRVYLTSEGKSRIFVFKGTPSALKTFPQEEMKIDLRLYPNPGKGFINIQYSPFKGEKGKFRIYDVLGRLVKDLSPLKERGEILLSPANFPFNSGVYILRVETEKKSFLHKFIWLR
ncbi:MAG: T9SS type A sorting domain-containing protein [candidate division WOR-3 bacterium]